MYLTVYFNGQFWCGLIEIPSRQASSNVYHYIFGPEPKTAEIFTFIYTILPQLITTTEDQNAHTTPSLSPKKKINPKRMQRMLNQQKKQPIVSTKSQRLLQQQHLEKKSKKKKQRKEQKQQQKQQRFEQKQQKNMPSIVVTSQAIRTCNKNTLVA